MPGLGRRGELAFRLPLQKLEKLDPIAMSGSEFGDFGRVRIAHRRRPIAPREPAPFSAIMLMQRLEDGEVAQRSPFLLLKSAKTRAEPRACGAVAVKIEPLKAPPQRLKYRS